MVDTIRENTIYTIQNKTLNGGDKDSDFFKSQDGSKSEYLLFKGEINGVCSISSYYNPGDFYFFCY